MKAILEFKLPKEDRLLACSIKSTSLYDDLHNIKNVVDCFYNLEGQTDEEKTKALSDIYDILNNSCLTNDYKVEI